MNQVQKIIYALMITVGLNTSIQALEVGDAKPDLSAEAFYQLLTKATQFTERNPRNNPSRSYVTVGVDADCDFNTMGSMLQDAINSGAEEIRVMQGTYEEQLIISNTSLMIKSQYKNCFSAHRDRQDGNKAIIKGDYTDNLMTIQSRSNNDVLLVGLMIMNGKNGIVSQGAQLALADVSVLFNAENGVQINGGDMYIANSSLAYNYGSGLKCSFAEVLMYGASGISENNSSGVYLSDCYMLSMAGIDPNNPATHLHGIAGNQSDEGGGAYLDYSTLQLMGEQFCIKGERLHCFGDDAIPASITDNYASGVGGGVVVHRRLKIHENDPYCDEDCSSLPSHFIVSNGLISGNEARLSGGAIRTEQDNNHNGNIFDNSYYGNSSVSVKAQHLRFDDSVEYVTKRTHCWNENGCNQFSNNVAPLAAVIDSGLYTDVLIQDSIINNNLARWNVIAHIRHSDSPTQIVFQGNLIFDNEVYFGVDESVEASIRAEGYLHRDPSILQRSLFYTDEYLLLTDSTIVNNHAIDLIINSSPLIGRFKAKVSRSIIQESAQLFPNPGFVSGSPSSNCLIVVWNTDSLGFAENIYNSNNDFTQDYMLTDQSLAIDLCQPPTNSGLIYDLSGQLRGTDDPIVWNQQNNSTWDAGAYEFIRQ